MFSKSCAILLLSAAVASALTTDDVSLDEDVSSPRVFFANYTSSKSKKYFSSTYRKQYTGEDLVVALDYTSSCAYSYVMFHVQCAVKLPDVNNSGSF